MKIFQKSIKLTQKKRGFHLITPEIMKAIDAEMNVQKGICHVFIRHTSASLTINENADPTVRKDFETFFNRAVKENAPDFMHDTEGPDDMPAHIKSSLLGSSVTIPIINGRLALGTWQGIYLAEHRARPHRREMLLSFIGSKR